MTPVAESNWCVCLHRRARHDGDGSCSAQVRPIRLDGWGPHDGEPQPCSCRQFVPQPPDDDEEEDE